VDFLSRSTITGFMGGTAAIIILQQLKGMLGMKHFTSKTDIISVVRSIFLHRDEVSQIIIARVHFASICSAPSVPSPPRDMADGTAGVEVASSFASPSPAFPVFFGQFFLSFFPCG